MNQMQMQQIANRVALYKKNKNLVWVIQIENNKTITYCTGFSTSEKLVLTTAQSFNDIDNSIVRGRRLNENGFIHKLDKVHINYGRDLALFEFENTTTDSSFVELADDGALVFAEQLYVIGNVDKLVGSFGSANVCYPCVDQVDPILFTYKKRCANFIYDRLKAKKPCYRIMGHIVNTFTLDSESNEDNVDFLKSLYASTPIIQCNGFECVQGFNGSPIFKENGQVVGILSVSASTFGIAIHICAIKTFLEEAFGNKDDDNNPSVKKCGRKCKVSKKRKASFISLRKPWWLRRY